MASLSQAQLSGSVNTILEEHAKRIAPKGMVADQVFPQLEVKAKKGQLLIWDDSNLQIPDDTYRANGAKARSMQDPEPSYITYTCLNHSRRVLVTQESLDIAESQGAGAQQLEFAITQKMVEQLMLEREKNLADKLNATANYETGYSTTIAAGSVWTADAGDPIGDIETGLKKLASGGVFPNAAIMDYQVWVTLARHSALLEMTKHVKRGMISEDDFMSIFGLKPIVSKAVYDSAGTKASVWGDSCILANVSSAPDANSPDTDAAFGRTLMFEPFSVIEYDAPEYGGRRGAKWVEANHSYVHQFVGVDNATDGDSIAGYLIDNAI